jgi:hypothetical protein
MPDLCCSRNSFSSTTGSLLALSAYEIGGWVSNKLSLSWLLGIAAFGGTNASTLEDSGLVFLPSSFALSSVAGLLSSSVFLSRAFRRAAFSFRSSSAFHGRYIPDSCSNKVLNSSHILSMSFMSKLNSVLFVIKAENGVFPSMTSL